MANLSCESYEDFIGTLKAVVSGVDGSSQDLLAGHTVLPEQRPGRVPVEWIRLDLLGRGNMKISVLLRADNLYMVGFTNRSGNWYEMKNPYGRHMIPGSTFLRMGSSYPELLGYKKGKYGLLDLHLGMNFFLNAIGSLYNYPFNRIPDEYLGRILAGLIAMICEAQRIIPIRQRIAQFWQGNAYLNERHAKYTVTWGKMCLLLFCWKNNVQWDSNRDSELTEMKIRTPDDVLNVVDIIIWTRIFDINDPETSCTPRS
ncbi:hypothetical protein C2845_PM01G34650 [Panicum miliaceum]|uniref:rRNA N-glycosylase n=1 Tax=Panicum miliaceum TaxID=4540 RepID=A0A3L6TMY5_PANMI|nr:hypothetical protein C2845_PM01G34650 [Panicum miliaceum]